MLVRVKVKTGTRRESVREVGEHHFDICVREEAERNEANRRIIELVAARYGVPAARVRLVKGHHRPSKIFSIT